MLTIKQIIRQTLYAEQVIKLAGMNLDSYIIDDLIDTGIDGIDKDLSVIFDCESNEDKFYRNYGDYLKKIVDDGEWFEIGMLSKSEIIQYAFQVTINDMADKMLDAYNQE